MFRRRRSRRSLNSAMMNKKSGLYIHIPYCLSKCNYCGFLSRPTFNSAGFDEIENYTKEVVKEIKMRSIYAEKDVFDTIYLGGGTPSLLSPYQIEKILNAIYTNYRIDEKPEITVEANPETLNFEKLRAYHRLNVNRLSIGVQSFNDDILKTLGRIHTGKKAVDAYENARRAGYDNINMDLMFSIPKTSLDDVIEDINSAIRLEPEHISFYSLQLEPGTRFFDDFESGNLEEIPDETDRKMYHSGCDLLRSSGYSQYEISNFSRVDLEKCEDHRSKHNSKYWNMSTYIGIGLGASSYLYSPKNSDETHSGYERTRNYSGLDEYIDAIGNNILPFEEEIFNTFADDMSEAIFTGLRRAKGISYEEIGISSREEFEKIHMDSLDEISSFISSGHLEMDSFGIRLTRKGIDISNRIMALFV